MDISKVKAAIAAARGEVKKAIDAEIAGRSFDGLKALAGVDTRLVGAEEKLEAAAQRAKPRERKAKKEKTK